MIPYPARPSGGYPTTPGARRAERARIRTYMLDRLEAAARVAGRSLVCAEYADHSTCSGAVVCICPCHD